MHPRWLAFRLPLALALALGAALGCPAAQSNPPLPDVGGDEGGGAEGDTDVPEPPHDVLETTEADEATEEDVGRDDATGGCTSDLDCNDLLDCTSDFCDGASGICTNQPIDAVCDDGNACTTGERCDPTTGCIPGTVNDCADGIDCTRDVCDPFTGACSHSGGRQSTVSADSSPPSVET